MSLQRTPPATAVNPTGSVLSMASLSDSEDRCKLRRAREKRKRDDTDLGSCMAEMKKMFEGWQAKQEEKLTAFQQIMEDFKQNCNQFTASFTFITNQYEDLKCKSDLLQRENDQLAARTQLLEYEIEKLHQSSRASFIEMRNVPTFKEKSESKEYLLELITKAGMTFGLDLHCADLKDVYRINAKPGVPKPIIAEFTSVLTKEKFINASKAYNKRFPGNRFNTSNLHLNCLKSAVYISEVLTSRMKKLHFLAREFAKTHRYTYCWAAHGRVYLREKENAPAIRIFSEKDLDKLLTNK